MIRRVLIALALVVATLALAPVGPAAAVGFTVDSNGDAPDANLADPACATAANVCTLRAAIMQANATAGTDVVTVPAMTIELGSALTLSTNVTLRGAGARKTILHATGGAHAMLLVSSGIAVVSGVTVTGATGGGALAVNQSGGDLTLKAVRVTKNIASAAGAAYGPVYSVNGTLTVRDSEISGNSTTSTSSSAWGGGLSLYGSTVTVLNTTIAGNSAVGASGQGALGGGVWAGLNSNVTITSSTVAGNTVSSTSAYGAGIYQNSGGSGSTEVKDSIVALPLGATSCTGGVGSKMPVFLGRNLLDDTSCGAAGATRTIAPAGLTALADNGGQTNTRAPAPGSPAINAASTCATPADQRGQARPVAGACDLGAVELGSDRRAAVSVSNRSPLAGSDIIATATARNNGLDRSTGTVLTVTASRARVLSATATRGSCKVSGGKATCKLGTVAGGTSVKVLLGLRMPSSGTVTVRATMSGKQPDPVRANNSAATRAVVRRVR
ncbi:choice-of-anchor Q domain-containing protein [Nocardioides sp.]|uniref:choice-of-anchor Q domain-containing protein n=1 Tax=Nocardioides sp. TaxID=35761 RepID=UPI0037839F9C